MSFEKLFPLKVVINLDKRTDRLKSCTEEFVKIKTQPIRKPGMEVSLTDNSWWNGAIGCMITHKQILHAAISLNTNVFIFEDDVSFIGKYPKSVLDKACKELEDLKWDMLYIGGNLLKPAKQVTPHLARLTHCQSTVAYGVNARFVEDLFYSIDLNKITKPIDMIYADDIIPSHNCFITIPMLAIQKDSYSDIEKQEVKYSDYLEKRYWDNLVLDKN